MKTFSMSPGDVITKEGAQEKKMYLLKSGSLNVLVQREGKNHKVGEVKEGELVGEMSFVDGKPRSATVVAASDCELIEVSVDSFQNAIDALPLWLQQFIQTLTRRLREHNFREY